jgi:Phospholipase D C terminal
MQVNWKTFITGRVNQNLTGHLMKYPIQVHRDDVVYLEALSQDIPDFPGAKMFGGDTKLPPVLTT